MRTRKRDAGLAVLLAVVLLYWSATPAAPSHVTASYACTANCESAGRKTCGHSCLNSPSACACDCVAVAGTGGYCAEAALTARKRISPANSSERLHEETCDASKQKADSLCSVDAAACLRDLVRIRGGCVR